MAGIEKTPIMKTKDNMIRLKLSDVCSGGPSRPSQVNFNRVMSCAMRTGVQNMPIQKVDWVSTSQQLNRRVRHPPIGVPVSS
mmetsp:Transcript_12015/g.28498  ORF Transcript_12015/g.28498 Transcript_12015/m.28498 type:complete len:82 (-) Transcript_12015:773-1018(-)